MSTKRRCKHGRVKRTGRCRRKRATRRSSRGLKIAGMGVGTLAVFGLGALGAYKFWESQGA